MELILISSNKLKVTLDGSDREKYELDEICQNMNICESKSMKRLLDDIRRMSGFNTQKEGLVVEMFGPCNGSFEIFITQTRDRSDNMSGGNDKMQKQYHTDTENRVYIFEALSDLISVCRALVAIGISCESSAYKEGGRYYLALLIPENANDIYRERLALILDFGARIMNAYAYSYLCEHAIAICKGDAIDKLSRI